jgi:hypothetical protein
MSDKSNKKPVWVDELAHGILKEYCTVAKRQMVEVATGLILDHLAALEAGGSAPSAAAAPAEPAPAAPAAAAAPSRKPSRPDPRPDSEPKGSVRYLGGVWLV